MEQTRRATEERDQKRECGESAHHPYGSGPLAVASSRANSSHPRLRDADHRGSTRMATGSRAKPS
jgi:hypothetical protein